MQAVSPETIRPVFNEAKERESHVVVTIEYGAEDARFSRFFQIRLYPDLLTQRGMTTYINREMLRLEGTGIDIRVAGV